VRRRGAVLAAGALVAMSVLVGCSNAAPQGVGYLDTATAQSPLEDGDATTVLPASMVGADLLVAVVMGDGPDNPANQHSVLADSGRHQWTLRDHHVVFGSIIDVYTAPDGRHRGEPVAERSDRRVRRAAWGNGPGATPAPRTPG
jgi:hypothetical protein